MTTARPPGTLSLLSLVRLYGAAREASGKAQERGTFAQIKAWNAEADELYGRIAAAALDTAETDDTTGDDR
jgi:hypothetical protein